MYVCSDCGNDQVRIGANYCDECGVRLDPQVGVDPEATLKPAAAKALKRKRQAEAEAAATQESIPQPAAAPPAHPKPGPKPKAAKRKKSRITPDPTRAPAQVATADLPFNPEGTLGPSRGGAKSAAVRRQPAKVPKTPRKKAPPKPKAQDPPPWARGIGWEAWSTAGPMPERVRVDGEEWVRIDDIEMRNRDAEERHAWAIQGTGRVMRERESQRYPGGSAIETRGYRHEGGAVRFRLLDLTPGAPVVFVRQAWANGTEHGEVKVDNRSCVRVRESEVDGRSALRNRAVVIPAAAVTRDQLDVEVVDTGSQRGLTWFHVWIYQPAYVADAASAAESPTSPGRRAGVTIPNWSSLRGTGRDLPATIAIDDHNWRLVDEVQFSDEDSMEEHGFTVVDSQGTYVAFELAIQFPDGAKREERGVRFDHGEATWEVSGLTADKEVAMILRTDVHRANQTFDLSVDGHSVGRVRIDARDPVKRGRHWEALVPGAVIRSDTTRFRASISDPGRGLTLFGIWFYQPD